MFGTPTTPPHTTAAAAAVAFGDAVVGTCGSTRIMLKEPYILCKEASIL